MSISLNFTDQEREIIEQHRTPDQVQQFLNGLEYNFESDGVETLRSFRRVVRDRVAHCMEGAVAAAVMMREQGYPTQLLCMEARDIDHMIFPYQRGGLWGSLAQSRDENLKGRPPAHATLRDLVMSYYPHYWNYYTEDRNDLTIRGFATLDLSDYVEDMATAERDVWELEDIFYECPYEALFPEPGKRFFRVDREKNITWLE